VEADLFGRARSEMGLLGQQLTRDLPTYVLLLCLRTGYRIRRYGTCTCLTGASGLEWAGKQSGIPDSTMLILV